MLIPKAANAALSVLIPLYIYPDGNAWANYTNSIIANPSVQFNVIINPDSGPGTTSNKPYPDSNFIAGIAKLNALPNVRTIGYVHTSYSRRKLAAVQQDIALYAAWGNYLQADIRMRGIFFDEAPAKWTAPIGGYMSAASTSARNALAAQKNAPTKNPFVMYNPGTISDTRYYMYADNIVVFESPSTEYNAGSVQAAVPAAYRAMSTIMVQTVPSLATQTADVAGVRSAGFGGVYISDVYNYDVTSTFWAAMVKQVASLK